MAERSPDGLGAPAVEWAGPTFVSAGTTALDDDGDLADSLTALSRLSMARLSLTDLLIRVAMFAVQAIPGADGAGLTVIEHDRPDTIVTSAAFVGHVDAIQYRTNAGPVHHRRRDRCDGAVRVVERGPPMAPVRAQGRPARGAQCVVPAAAHRRGRRRDDERVRPRQRRVR